MLTILVGLSLAGCGDGQEATGVPPDTDRAPRGEEIVVAALGDSITAGSPLWDPDRNNRARISAPDPRSQYEYWAARKDARLRFRNCGVYGERVDQIADRLDACAKGADVLIVQGGINDIAQRRPVEAAAERLRELVQRGRERGLRVVLVDVLPWNNGYPEAVEPIRRLNELIEAIGREENVPVLRFHDTLEDPDRPGRIREEWTADGDHPSVEGYRRLGELAFRLPPGGPDEGARERS
ncbi:MAG: SGNH/GDSL hydrolase family protein [Actinobacteria bacterium]|nr:SGNH/GDSL hydrolase family protein [Actinomycetota bacterium]